VNAGAGNVLDVSQTSSNLATQGTTQWQSFTAGKTGNLNKVRFHTNGWSNGSQSFTFQIYSGTGTGGSLLYSGSGSFNTPSSDWFDMSIPAGSRPSVTSGSTYTAQIQFTGSYHQLSMHTGNVYSGSYYSSYYSAAQSAPWDLVFDTYVDELSKLCISGAISNSGTFTATSGTIEMNGSSAQTIPSGCFSSSNTIKNLIVNNSSGVTLGGAFNITGDVTPTSGTLTTGGYLNLKSTSSGTGAIQQGSSAGGYISGNVTIERYVPGKRAYRFFAHPFSSSIGLNALTDDIDITGSGGSTNGFTSTSTNNASSYWYDVTTGDNSTTGNNPGWAAYTNTNGSGSNAWLKGQVARVMVRGSIGQNLGVPSTYTTPNAVTLDLTGAVNQGDQTISLTKGSGTNFVLVGNPFPCQVNMDQVSGTNLGSSFYIWDATQGTKGGYTSYSYGSSGFKLPSCGGFATTISANGSIVFEEADKTQSAGSSMFKTTGTQMGELELKVEDSSLFYDRLLVRFDDNGMSATDYLDAAELYNPDVTFYSMSSDDSMLSIDVRPYASYATIPLGIYSTLKQDFKIVTGKYDIPSGVTLYLHDKYLNKKEVITGLGYSYSFTIDSNAGSWGNERFELMTEGHPTGISGTLAGAASNFTAKLVPNPANEVVTVYAEGGKSVETQVYVRNILGTVVREAKGDSKVTVGLQGLSTGVYHVEVIQGLERKVLKLVKE
jgi:hypothetical protein